MRGSFPKSSKVCFLLKTSLKLKQVFSSGRIIKDSFSICFNFLKRLYKIFYKVNKNFLKIFKLFFFY